VINAGSQCLAGDVSTKTAVNLLAFARNTSNFKGNERTYNELCFDLYSEEGGGKTEKESSRTSADGRKLKRAIGRLQPDFKESHRPRTRRRA